LALWSSQAILALKYSDSADLVEKSRLVSRMSDSFFAEQRAEIDALNRELLSTNSPEFTQDEVAIIQIESERIGMTDSAASRRPAAEVAFQSRGTTGWTTPVRMNPNSDEAFPRSEIAIARELLDAGDMAGAARYFDRVLTRDSANADAWLGMARTRYLAGDAAAANAALDEAFLLRPTSTRGFLLRAQIHRSSGNFEGALGHLWKLVAKNLTELPILIEVLSEVEAMQFHRDTILIAEAIMEIDIDNEIAATAKQRALSSLTVSSS
jgi:tetratricopeptide (TPR) repeat protein